MGHFSLNNAPSPNETTKCPPHACCFSSFRWMDSKLTRWQLATNRHLYSIWGEKKFKLFFSTTTVKPKKWCYVMFIVIHYSGPAANVAFKGGGVSTQGCVCGRWTQEFLWTSYTNYPERIPLASRYKVKWKTGGYLASMMSVDSQYR